LASGKANLKYDKLSRVNWFGGSLRAASRALGCLGGAGW
jgi:hypothetical protein